MKQFDQKMNCHKNKKTKTKWMCKLDSFRWPFTPETNCLKEKIYWMCKLGSFHWAFTPETHCSQSEHPEITP